MNSPPSAHELHEAPTKLEKTNFRSPSRTPLDHISGDLGEVTNKSRITHYCESNNTNTAGDGSSNTAKESAGAPGSRLLKHENT